ncbi:hypothetical protein [Gilliamella sp. Pas-s25]|uniref:hypothetical protein n=1 Tax=Gilliamella sp. Pas-s25 TaxID=2687310 RepID=UPI00135E142B|nr:hypothetical protein [Gilliamella sp. Pas-s25]MWP61537.1 hypothetical protein [Gilliamella sp. Pas-s25]
MSSSWNLQALGVKNGQEVNNRSDAIILPPSPIINFVRPSTHWGSIDDNAWRMNFAGPAGMWQPKKGFFVQSIDPASYALNFPTTGANGLYFDLLMDNVDESELTWAPVTHEGITATVKRVPAIDDWIERPLPTPRDVVTCVILTGPEALEQINIDEPTRITVPRLPQTFELVGRDNHGNEIVKYGFVLQNWFVNRWIHAEPPDKQSLWCSNLGYRLPKTQDLTNAFCTVDLIDGRRCEGVVGATPSSSGNHYQRRIGGGLLAEWGAAGGYYGSRFIDSGYWSSAIGIPQFVNVAFFRGTIYSDVPFHYGYYGVCVTP